MCFFTSSLCSFKLGSLAMAVRCKKSNRYSKFSVCLKFFTFFFSTSNSFAENYQIRCYFSAAYNHPDIMTTPFIFQNSDMSKNQATNVWNSLKRGIEEIQNGNAGTLRFEELYRNAYTLVLHKHGELLYRGVDDVICAKLNRTADEVITTTGLFSLSFCFLFFVFFLFVSLHSYCACKEV